MAHPDCWISVFFKKTHQSITWLELPGALANKCHAASTDLYRTATGKRVMVLEPDHPVLPKVDLIFEIEFCVLEYDAEVF